MVIKSVDELKKRPIEIDLSGPEGNVFNLIGKVKTLGKMLDMNSSQIKTIQNQMMASDYDNAVEVFDKNFGDFVILYKP